MGRETAGERRRVEGEWAGLAHVCALVQRYVGRMGRQGVYVSASRVVAREILEEFPWRVQVRFEGELRREVTLAEISGYEVEVVGSLPEDSDEVWVRGAVHWRLFLAPRGLFEAGGEVYRTLRWEGMGALAAGEAAALLTQEERGE